MGLSQDIKLAGSIACLVVVATMAWRANQPPKPKTFALHVDGSPGVPFILEVNGPGSVPKRLINGVIPKDYTFDGKGSELIIVTASRPKEAPFGVIELTLSRGDKEIDKDETKPPQNLARVSGR